MIKKTQKKFKKFSISLLFIFILFHLNNQLYLSTYLPDNYTPSVEFVQSVYAKDKVSKENYKENFLPKADYLQGQWNLDLMNIGEAWADGYTGKGVKIAILDTGFYHKHPDISLAGGYSVFSDDPWSNDHSGHGTHIAGIISANRDTNYQGIAPDAEVYGIKIYHSDDVNENDDVSTDVQSVVKGIRQAINMESDIIVISSGLNYHDEDLYAIIKEAYDEDILIIAASGNSNPTVNYPASYSEVIAVTALDEELNPALDIIYGQENEFSAPGVNIGGLSIPDSSYSYPYIFMSGSSQATPHAAGLAAIFMQKYQVKGENVRKIMKEQAVPIGEPGLFGHGLLYYRSNETLINNSTEKGIQPKQEAKQNKEKDNNSDDDGVRKPFSSREADNDVEEDDLLNYQNIVVTRDDEGFGMIDGSVLSQLEVGGTLELLMGSITSLNLTEKQIYEIRKNNLSVVLSKIGIAWKIPPSNFVPGQALLRFYEGGPLGTADAPEFDSNIHTISIFQNATRQGLYPSEMEVRYDLDYLAMPNPAKLEAAYFNKESAQWLPLEEELKDDYITLKTRFTGAVGFFNLKEITEFVEVDEHIIETDEEITVKNLYQSLAIFVSIVLIFTTAKLIFKKMK